MKKSSLNLLGSYGPWAAERTGGIPGPLSFLNTKWRKAASWKSEAKKKIFELIAMPDMKKTPEVRITKKYRFDDLDIEELSWTLPYGPQTEAVFIKPAGQRGRLPGILGLHDHGGIKYFGKRKIIRTSEKVHPFIASHQKEYYGGSPWANELAKRGYGVLVHDIFPFGSRRISASELPSHVVKRLMMPPLEIEEVKAEDFGQDAATCDYDVPEEEPDAIIRAYNTFGEQMETIIAKSLFSAGLTWPGVFLSEDIYALDYLASRPDIDKYRLGCCGLSGGGLRTDYLAGLDERIRCSVTSGFMTTWRDLVLNVSYTHTWMTYIPLLPKLMDFPEILGMRVPLPALVLATKSDQLFTTREVERAGKILERIYKKAGKPDAFKISFYEGPHKFDLPMQSEAFEWLDRWLKSNQGRTA